jgi:UDP-2-acetamido-3-amino-2,3-dideoxy-glucuronate N-acetyltransferase
MQGNFIHKTALIEEKVTIGHFVSIGHSTTVGDNSRIEDGARVYNDCFIGNNCIIGANAVLRPRTRLGDNSIFGTLSCSEGDNIVGNFTTIHAQCHITKGVSIGDNCFIAPFFIATNTPVITDGRHGVSPSDYKFVKTSIENDVRIGANVRLTPGLTIGAFSVIDQDTFITKNVPPHSRVRGGKDKIGVVIGEA